MTVKDTYFSKKPNINIRGKLFDLSEPCVMGIINITPDSFYKGSRFIDEERVLLRAVGAAFSERPPDGKGGRGTIRGAEGDCAVPGDFASAGPGLSFQEDDGATG